MYALVTVETYEGATASIVRIGDWAFIPEDERNLDYRQYLVWLEAGNTPEPWVPPEPNES